MPTYWKGGFSMVRRFSKNLVLVSLVLTISCQQQDRSYPLVEVPEVGAAFYQSSLTEAERLVEADPDNPDAYYKKAIYLEAVGRIDEALSTVKQAINLDPAPDYLLKEAQLLEHTGDYETALARVSRAQILGGDYPDLWHLMAKLNYLQGNLNSALSEVNQALLKYPESLTYYCTKGKIEWALNDTLKALESFSNSVTSPETSYESLKYLALINQSTGDFEKAFAYLDQNLKEYPKDREVLLHKGKLFSENGQYDSALVVFHYLSVTDSTDIEPLYQSAVAHFHKRWYDSTLYYAQKALQIDDHHLPSLLAEARVYDRRTYYGTSMRKYGEILAIDSTYQPAVEELAKLKGKVAYLQKIRQDREANLQVETISPTKPPIRD